MSDVSYDLVVIGGGPGGYVAAIRAAQLGMTTACVDLRGSLGGTCLNVGCIPSKALLQSSEHYAEASDGLAKHGINVGNVGFNLDAMMDRKNEIVDSLTKGVEYLLKKNHVEHLIGRGRIVARGVVGVTLADGEELLLKTKGIVLATGSEPSVIPGVEIDDRNIVTSEGALDLRAVPKTLVVIGGGYIGLELGSVWSRLGAKVVVVEFCDRIVPGMDGEIATNLQRILRKQGLSFKLGRKVSSAIVKDSMVEVSLDKVGDGSSEHLSADVVLVAVGRKPYTLGLGLEEIGIKTQDGGFVGVNDSFETDVPGIFAIGDLVSGPMLAHKAEEDGMACVEAMAGNLNRLDYRKVPGVIYTAPEVAVVGQTEEELKKEGIHYRVGKFPFMANARSRVIGATDGFVKILAEEKTKLIKGVHMIGPDAGTMIGEAVLAMEMGTSAEELARTCHAHPTYAEAIKEAALAVGGRAIHI